MSKEIEKIKCVILTLRKQNVILPSELVAEIISVKDIEEVDSSEEWFLGNISWRGVEIPLISFEVAGGMEASRVNLNAQAAVLYSVNKEGRENKFPYLGLIVSSMPHVSSFSRNQMILNTEDNEGHPMISQKIKINGASVSILDVDSMVDMISELAA